jgi:exodeoxyribonuclease VII large subunit
MAVPVRAELEATLAALASRLQGCVSRRLERDRQAVRAAARALPTPDQLLGLKRRRFDEAESRLQRALEVGLERKRARLAAIRLTPAALSRRMSEARLLIGRDMARAQAALFAVVRERRERFRNSSARLTPVSILRRQRQQTETLAGLARRGDQALDVRLERLRARLTQADRLLSTLKLSEQSILERGYALVLDEQGALVRRAGDIAAGQTLELRFADGAATATAKGGKPVAEPARARPVQKPKDSGNQGSLF